MVDNERASTLKGVWKLGEYRRSSPERERVFPSQGALDWFVRQNRVALVRAGALVMLTGQWHVREQLFDAFVLQAGQEAAQRHAAQSLGSAEPQMAGRVR